MQTAARAVADVTRVSNAAVAAQVGEAGIFRGRGAFEVVSLFAVAVPEVRDDEVAERVGNFASEDVITYAELLTVNSTVCFLMEFVGRVCDFYSP